MASQASTPTNATATTTTTMNGSSSNTTTTTTTTTAATPNKYDIETLEEQQHLGPRFSISQHTRFFEIPGADIDHDVDAILSPPPKQTTGNNSVVSPHLATTPASKQHKRRSQSRQYTGQFYSQLMKEWINIYVDDEGTPYYVSGEHAGYREVTPTNKEQAATAAAAEGGGGKQFFH
mmetsp:Transcript_30039/g.34517  ORF Transcript_30039/g.34517 Transcript_30039/m.34517 type:complete len:177 (+) Transcript_30039:85-615(+)